MFTRRYLELRSEGKHGRNGVTQFDYDNKQTITTNLTTGKVKHSGLPEPAQDVISSLYYARTQDLRLDAEETFLLNTVDTNLVVNIRPDQRKQLNVHALGDVQALRIEPKPTLKIVAANNGRMWFWISDDNRRLPLLVVSDMKIGSAKLVLFKIESAKTSTVTGVKPSVAASPSTPPPAKTPLAATP